MDKVFRENFIDLSKKIKDLETKKKFLLYQKKLLNDVYAAQEVDSEILSREPPQEYLDEWRDKLETSYLKKESTRDRSLLIFRFEEMMCGLHMEDVSDIAFPKPIHKIPFNHFQFVVGSVNFKGNICTVFRLDAFLTHSSKEEKTKNKIEQERSSKKMILLKERNNEFVFFVDELIGIFEIPLIQFEALPIHVIQDENHVMSHIVSWNEYQDVFLIDKTRLLEKIVKSKYTSSY